MQVILDLGQLIDNIFLLLLLQIILMSYMIVNYRIRENPFPRK